MSDAAEALSAGPDAQRSANDHLWGRRGLVHSYATRELRPAEVLLLVRYREQLTGRVLELGCGAGRLTGYLGDIAADAHGIDISPEMVAYCRRTYPKVTFSQGDMREVATLAPGPWDVVFATYNVLDVLSDEERRKILDRIHGILQPGALLIMSTHNLAYAPHLADPFKIRNRGLVSAALTLVQYPRWRRNRKRLLAFEQHGPDYSILNDLSHDFSALHYYISRDAQERQLNEHGFDLLECLDLEGRRLEPGDEASDCSELQYVARRRPDTDGSGGQ
jgi:SAM-dependent methyltransferase